MAKKFILNKKQLNTNIMSKNFIKSALLGAGILLGCSAAYANGMIGNGEAYNNLLGSVEIGKTYTLSSPGEYYTFNPTTSGAISVQTNYTGNKNSIYYSGGGINQVYFFESPNQGEPGLYSDTDAAAEPQLNDEGYQFIFYVNAGTQYLFGYAGDVATGPFEFTVDNSDVVIPDVMTYCLPAPGTTFDYASGQPDITMEFKTPLVSVESVALSYTDKQGNPQSKVIPSHYETGWAIESNLLIVRVAHTKDNEIFKEVKDDADTSKPFYLDVTKAMGGTGPVTSAKFINGYPGAEYVLFPESLDGSFKVQYEFVENVSLVSAELPETFYSYWAPGSPEGMATLTFDGPIVVKGAMLSLTMGEHYAGSPSGGDDPDPSWNIDYSLNDDNTVLTLNFTGINYAEGLTKNYSSVTIMITGIKGENTLVAIMGNGTNVYSEIIPYVNEPYDGAEIPDEMTGKPTIDPENYSLVRELQDVVVTWDSPVSLVSGMDAEVSVVLGNNAPQTVQVFEAEGSLVIALTEIEIPNGRYSGNCEIAVPAGLVKNADGEVNGKLTIVYTFSVSNDSNAIDSILDSNDGETVIYDLKGNKVVNPEHGIYIINGKKVVL